MLDVAISEFEGFSRSQRSVEPLEVLG